MEQDFGKSHRIERDFTKIAYYLRIPNWIMDNSSRRFESWELEKTEVTRKTIWNKIRKALWNERNSIKQGKFSKIILDEFESTKTIWYGFINTNMRHWHRF